MKQDVFTQKKVASYLSENFIFVILDIDNDMLPEGFSFYAVPTFFVVDEKGKQLDRVVGGADATQFFEYIKEHSKKK